MSGVADGCAESEEKNGVPRYIDEATESLGGVAASFDHVIRTRLALAQRQQQDFADEMQKVEQHIRAVLNRNLRKHPLWEWLQMFPGLGGVHTARLISRIGDPRRFPGQRCEKGHYLPPLFDVGSPCGALMHDDDPPQGGAECSAESDSPNGSSLCGAPMLAPREGTGTRSLWHYCGLHVVEGRSPRKRKGFRMDWDPIARTCVLMPDGGIAAQIVKQRVPVYRDIYDDKKARLIELRGAVSPGESDKVLGPSIVGNAEQPGESDQSFGVPSGGRGAVTHAEIDGVLGPPLRPFQIDNIARKFAAKAFVGDLLAEWKRLA